MELTTRLTRARQQINGTDATAWGLAALFLLGISWMTWRQYAVFHINAPDVATFGQGIWNTLNGRFLFSTIIQRSVLSYHFTPFFALLSPLLLLWEDVRILFLAQTLGLTAAGLLLYQIAKPHGSRIALVILLAFYLNPALHEIALTELRRSIFSIPFLALAVYALTQKRYPLMSLALLLALLCKENVGIPVFMIGFYLLVFQRQWRWGALWMGIGFSWVIVVTFCVIPSLHPEANGFSCSGSYPQLNYFSIDTGGGALSTPVEEEAGLGFPTDFITGLLGDPAQTLQRMLDQPAQEALWRIFLPLGLLLPLLGGEWLLLALPSMGLMLLSTTPNLHTMQDWYLSTIIIFFFAALITAFERLGPRWRPWGAALLLGTTLLGYWQYSGLPGGRLFLPIRYQLTPHHAQAQAALERIPPEAAVAAQDAFVVPLALRENIYLYPWYTEKDPLDFIILDSNLKYYPFELPVLESEINTRVADPALTIVTEVDGLYIFATDSPPHPSVDISATAEESIHLSHIELAYTDGQGFYEPFDPLSQQPLEAGQTLRVTLYWEALAKPSGDRTVSVRLSQLDGWVLSQQDSVPSNGGRPTSWWEPGWFFRDVYYLTLPADLGGGEYPLSLRLYDSYTQAPVPLSRADGEPLEELSLVTLSVRTKIAD